MNFIDNEIKEIIHLYKTDKQELLKRTKQSIMMNKQQQVEKKIQGHFKDFSFRDWTDYTELNCLEYQILLTKDQPLLDDDTKLLKVLGGERIDLIVYISLISNHFYLENVKTLYDPPTDKWSFKELDVKAHEHFPIIESFISDMEGSSYKMLQEADAFLLVPDVETRCLDKGEVKVRNLIFTDL